MYFFLRMFILVLTRKCVWFLFNSGIAENGAVTETTDIGEKMRRRFILIFLAGILFLSLFLEITAHFGSYSEDMLIASVFPLLGVILLLYMKKFFKTVKDK